MIETDDLPDGYSMKGIYGQYLKRQYPLTAPASKYEAEAVYFLETMGNRSQNGITSTTGPVYHMHFGTQWQQFATTSDEPNGSLSSGNYAPQYLDQVKTLFRNTHVHVDVVFGDASSIEIHAVINPWKSNTVFSGDFVEEE